MAVGRTVKEKLWRLLCRIKTAVNNIRKGKLKGHLLEVIVVLTLFVTLCFMFFQPYSTPKRKINFYFKNIQIEASYHRDQVLKIQKQKDELHQLEQFHSKAYGKLASEFEEALQKDISNGKSKEILLQEICRDTLHDIQGQYFASEGLHFDNGGNFSQGVGRALTSEIGDLVAQTKEGRGGLRSCALFDVGSSKSHTVLVDLLSMLETHDCDAFLYETTEPNVKLLEEKLTDAGQARRVKQKGFWNYTMEGKSAPFKVTTLDTLMTNQLQKDEYRSEDVIIARIGRMVDDSFWKQIHGGSDTIERIAGRRINLSPLQGLEKFLLTKRLTAVVWESYTDDKLKSEVEYISERGYKVYLVGDQKLVRIDRHYWDDKYAGSSESNSPLGIPKESLGTCHFSVTVVAFVEEHRINYSIQERKLPCVHFRGISCKCESFETDKVYDMC